MHFGVIMFPTDYSIGAVDLARAAEDSGFESLWFPEHTHIPAERKTPWPGGPELPREYPRALDPFVGLAAAAVATKTLKQHGVPTRLNEALMRAEGERRETYQTAIDLLTDLGWREDYDRSLAS